MSYQILHYIDAHKGDALKILLVVGLAATYIILFELIKNASLVQGLITFSILSLCCADLRISFIHAFVNSREVIFFYHKSSNILTVMILRENNHVTLQLS